MIDQTGWVHDFHEQYSDAPQIPEWLYDLAERHRARPEPREIGEKLREAQNQGFTQEQLALIMGSWQQNVSRWIQLGKRAK